MRTALAAPERRTIPLAGWGGRPAGIGIERRGWRRCRQAFARMYDDMVPARLLRRRPGETKTFDWLHGHAGSRRTLFHKGISENLIIFVFL